MIPKNWSFVQLGSVAESQYGYTAKAIDDKSLPKMLRITDIQNGKVDWENVPNCQIDGELLKKYLLQDGDIVIARTGTTTGKSYLLNNPINSVFASYLIRLRSSKNLNVKYLYYFLQSTSYWNQISELSVGIAQPGVNSSKLQRINFPLPPLDEQQRIVDIIENLFAKLDRAKALAQNVIDNYELRRSAILHKAFTGQLTNSNLDSWQKTNLENILLPMKTKKPSGDYFRYIDIDSIDNKRQVVKRAKVIETKEAPSRASREIEIDNILFSMVRPYLKNIALIDENLKDCIASTGFYICRCKENVIPKFLYRFLCSDETINYLMQFMRGDNSPSIRKDDFLNTKINLPNIDDQKEIVRILDSLLAKEQRTKELAEQILQKIDLMKKAILTQAFRGELTLLTH